MVMRLMILFIVSVMLVSCSKSYQDDDLSLPLQRFSGQNLRTDGYYFSPYASGEYREYYFFYRNGVLLNADASRSIDSALQEQNFRSQYWLDGIRKRKYNWGLFVIEDNTISFERWYPGDPPLKAFIRSGTILNDTVFRITSSRRSDGSNQKERDEYYYFRALSPKPDSTNEFIK